MRYACTTKQTKNTGHQAVDRRQTRTQTASPSGARHAVRASSLQADENIIDKNVNA
jgi:hypothetical protein